MVLPEKKLELSLRGRTWKAVFHREDSYAPTLRKWVPRGWSQAWTLLAPKCVEQVRVFHCTTTAAKRQRTFYPQTNSGSCPTSKGNPRKKNRTNVHFTHTVYLERPPSSSGHLESLQEQMVALTGQVFLFFPIPHS